MGKSTVETADTVPAALFISLAFSIAGWALLELWLVQVGAGFRAQGMAALFGLWLSFMSIRRPRIGRAGLPPGGIRLTTGQWMLGRADVGWILLFVVTGSVLGALVFLGSTLVLGTATMGLALVPWWQVSFCRSHVTVACTAVWSGMMLTIAPVYSSIHPMFLPLACWVLWTSATIALFMRIERMARAERRSRSTPPAPHPTTSSDIPA